MLKKSIKFLGVWSCLEQIDLNNRLTADPTHY